MPTPEQIREAVEHGINESLPEFMVEMESILTQQTNEIKALLPAPDGNSPPTFKSGVWIGIAIGGALFIGLLAGLLVGTLV